MNEKQSSLLEQRLRSEQPRYNPRAGFTERVMDSLPDHVTESASLFRPSIPWLRLVFALGLVSSIALVITQVGIWRASVSEPRILVEAESKTDSPATLTLPEISMTQVQEFSAKLDAPLQNELKNVISDTRQAIQFVASNFLPEN